MTRSQSLIAHMNANATIAGFVADRIYPMRASPPAGATTLTYRFDADFEHDRSQGTIVDALLYMRCWSPDYELAHGLADAIFTSLNNFKGLLGGVGGTKVIQCLIDHEEDEFETILADKGVFGVYLQYAMKYNL